jgi:hypothetical protein
MIYKLTAIILLTVITVVVGLTKNPTEYFVEYVKENEIYSYNISKENYVYLDKRCNYRLPVFMINDSIVKEDWNYIVAIKKLEIRSDDKSHLIIALCFIPVFFIFYSMLPKTLIESESGID